MKNFVRKPLHILLSAACVLMSHLCFSQIIVDSKNVSEDTTIQYIQFMYYMDSKSFKPVYLIDYGVIENADRAGKNQKIQIDNDEIHNAMSPMMVINKIDKAGWEYLGDANYIRIPLMENLLTFTFRRKEQQPQVENTSAVLTQHK